MWQLLKGFFGFKITLTLCSRKRIMGSIHLNCSLILLISVSIFSSVFASAVISGLWVPNFIHLCGDQILNFHFLILPLLISFLLFSDSVFGRTSVSSERRLLQAKKCKFYLLIFADPNLAKFLLYFISNKVIIWMTFECPAVALCFLAFRCEIVTRCRTSLAWISHLDLAKSRRRRSNVKIRTRNAKNRLENNGIVRVKMKFRFVRANLGLCESVI